MNASGIEIKKADGVYRTPLLKNVIPEPEPAGAPQAASSALAVAHWDGRLNCHLAIDIGRTKELVGCVWVIWISFDVDYLKDTCVLNSRLECF